uniref:Uncharacterized protein n=1 Tax=Sphaerodactylus townsendi TaxID=933632 RepID=A0ACB8FS65_9SAUR
MTKQQLQEECQKQNISCENKSVDETKALLLMRADLVSESDIMPNTSFQIQGLVGAPDCSWVATDACGMERVGGPPQEWGYEGPALPCVDWPGPSGRGQYSVNVVTPQPDPEWVGRRVSEETKDSTC